MVINKRRVQKYRAQWVKGGGAVGESVGPASGRLGVLIPAVTDQSRKNR